MADITERATAQVLIDSTEAAYELEVLKKKSKELKAEMDKAFKAGDKEGWMKLKKEADDLNGSMKKVKDTTVDVTRVMKNLNGTNLKDLLQAEKQLGNELKTMSRNTTEYAAKSKQLQLVTAEVRKVRTEMTGLNTASSGGFFGKMAGGFNKYFGMATAALASVTGLTLGVKKAVEAFNDFEKKLDNLSALTGLQGEELEYLSDQAKKLSVSTVDGGVRITQSADAIVDAYTKVGSARPELLKNKEALNQVTQEAIILSEAANGELQPAVDALAMVLNQFNAPATDARRIINALAAGSKEGAGEIPYLTTAIEKAGTVAADVGMNYEQLIGTIETLAPRITAPEIAGRSLKGVILDLQKTADDTNPAIVGFAQAIENLGKKQLSTNELMKIFGSENITVAKILIDNQNETKKYTEAVTGTNVALEQASINTDNNASKLEQARNRAKLVAIELGEKLAPAMTAVTGFGTKLLAAISGLVDIFVKYKGVIIPTIAAIAAYTVAINTVTVAKKAYTVATNIARIATEAFNKSSRKHIFGAIAAVLAVIVTSLLEFAQKTKSAQRSISDFTAQINEQRYALEQDFQALKNTNEGTEARKKAIQGINEKYGEYLPYLLTEKSSLEDITIAQNAANEALIRSIALKSKDADITAVIQQSQADIKEVSDDIIGEITKRSGSVIGGTATGALMDAFGRIRKGLSNGYSEATQFFTDFGAKASLSYNDVVDKFNKVHKTIYNEQQEIKKLNEFYNAYVKSLGDAIIPTVTTPTKKGGNTNQDGSGSGTQSNGNSVKTEEDKLKKFQDLADKYSDEFFLRQFDDDQRELELIKLKYDKELESVGLNEDIINDIRAKKTEEWTEEDLAAFNAYTANRNALELELNDKKQQQENKYNERKLAAQEEIWQATLDGEEAEMVSAMQKYDKLFLLAYENGVDTVKLKEMMDKEIANIHQKYLDQEVAKTKEAEEEKRKARQKSLQTTADIAGGLLNIVNGIQQIELEKAGENEEKKKAIQKKYADIQMVITIGKIIAATALGAMQAYELGPVAGAIMSGVIITEGIVEAGYAIAQRNKIKSLAVGGPTGSGYGSPDESGYKVAGVVHQDEYVIPAWERKVPQVMAMERIIESIRVNRTGYASGGAAQQPASISVQPQVVTYTDAAMIGLLQEIHKELKKPTRAKVVYSDFTDMEAKVNDVYDTFGK